MGDLVDPLASVRGYLGAARSEATKAAYYKDFCDFERWCDAHAARALPAEPLTVARYLASLADAGLTVSTINRRVAAMKAAHKAKGHEPPTNAEGVRETLRGIRRTIGAAPARKAPATVAAICVMLDQLPGTLSGLRDRALLLLGFAAALRRSELVALHVSDVSVHADGVVLHIRRSKTDQEARGADIHIPNGKRLKPVAALQAWLEAARIADGPLFREVDRHGRIGQAALQDRSVARIIKRAAARAGLDAALFAGHSLRAGFVTSALEDGVDVLRVMNVTRHKDPKTLKIYDRRARGFKDHAGGGFL